MTALACVLFWILVGLVASYLVLASGMVVALWRWRKPRLADAECPRTAVVLSLRGADPFLEQSLRALLTQDYPDFDAYLIVDHEGDPAWQIAERVIEQTGATNVHLEPLVERRATCARKCSAILQALAKARDTHEVIALMDSDMVPHATWLRELVGPLADEKVGVASGNRWYLPQNASLGALLRYFWNAAAVIQMYFYAIPWGGSLAIKAKIFRQSDLLDVWAHTLSDDQTLPKVMQRHGYKIAFVPSLMMENREDVPMKGFFTWMRRQLTVARLYHPCWPGVWAHAILTTLAPVAAMVVLIAGLASGEAMVATWAGAGLGAYVAGLSVLLLLLEAKVREIVRARGKSPVWLTSRAFFNMAPAFILTHILYGIGVVSLSWMRLFVWRRVVYRIDGPWKISVLEDRPYKAEHTPANQLISL